MGGRGKGGVRGLRSWTDQERFTMVLDEIGAQYEVEERGRTSSEYQELPKGTYGRVHLETTSFIFDRKGRHVGRVHMSRDECDYFTPRREVAS